LGTPEKWFMEKFWKKKMSFEKLGSDLVLLKGGYYME
jgi:hypothetical protein